LEDVFPEPIEGEANAQPAVSEHSENESQASEV